MQELWAAGFNAFKQLQDTDETEPTDLFAFRKLARGNSIQVVQPDGCCTYIRVDGTLKFMGHSPSRLSENMISPMFERLRAANAGGHVLEVTHKSLDVTDSSPGPACTLNLCSYPQGSNEKVQRNWQFDQLVNQVAAWDTGFVILLEDGTVRTLGDPRYGMCLGRVPGDAKQSWEPGVLPDLAGLGEKFVQIAAGGYTVAALTDNGSLYVWGMPTEGAYRLPQSLTIEGTPNYVEVDGGKDVAKVDIGESHAICLTTEGDVYVVGGNENGQLGLERQPKDRAHDWYKVDTSPLIMGRKIVDVRAGPEASFITTVDVNQKDAA